MYKNFSIFFFFIQVPENAISMNIFKKYLSQVLLNNARKKDDLYDPLQLYDSQFRTEVGRVLLNTVTDTPGPVCYIPIFYQECTSIKPGIDSKVRHFCCTGCAYNNDSYYCSAFFQNALMQQPLAHLYFLTVLEYLMSSKHNLSLSKLVDIANKISSMENLSNEHKVVLYIELQAVIQVILQMLSWYLDPSDDSQHRFGEIQCVVCNINQ